MSYPLFTIGKDRSITVASSSTLALSENRARVFARFTNDSDEVIYLMLGETARLNQGIRLEAAGTTGNSWEINRENRYTGSVYAICTSGSKSLLILTDATEKSSSSSSSSTSSCSSSFSSSSFSSSSSSCSSSFSSSSFSSCSSSFSSCSSSSFSSSSNSSSSSSFSSCSSSSSSSSFSSCSSSFSSCSSSFSSSSCSSSFSSSCSSSSSFSSSSSSSSMTLYESYITGDDADGDVYGDDWKAQTITPDETHTIRKVRLKLAREGTEPQTLTVSIKAVDVGGDPTAGDLASGTLDTDNLSDTAAWYDISFGAGVELTAATQYAIVTRQDGAYADRVYWRNDSTSASYDGGVFVMSDDAGTTWVQLATDDFMFEDWGS